jgi:hypothetical protein
MADANEAALCSLTCASTCNQVCIFMCEFYDFGDSCKSDCSLQLPKTVVAPIAQTPQVKTTQIETPIKAEEPQFVPVIKETEPVISEETVADSKTLEEVELITDVRISHLTFQSSPINQSFEDRAIYFYYALGFTLIAGSAFMILRGLNSGDFHRIKNSNLQTSPYKKYYAEDIQRMSPTRKYKGSFERIL